MASGHQSGKVVCGYFVDVFYLFEHLDLRKKKGNYAIPP